MQEVYNATKGIDKVAKRRGLSPLTVALAAVSANRGKLATWLKTKGVNDIPADNIELALLCTRIRIDEIKDHQLANGFANETIAEKDLIAEEESAIQRGLSFNGEIPDEFLGAGLLGSIFKAGKGSLDKINRKRVAKGKKAIGIGKKAKRRATARTKAQILEENGEPLHAELKAEIDATKKDNPILDKVVTIQNDSTNGPRIVADAGRLADNIEKANAERNEGKEPSDASIVAGEVAGEIKKHETKAWLKKNWWIIAIAVILIGGLGFLTGRKK